MKNMRSSQTGSKIWDFESKQKVDKLNSHMFCPWIAMAIILIYMMDSPGVILHDSANAIFFTLIEKAVFVVANFIYEIHSIHFIQLILDQIKKANN